MDIHFVFFILKINLLLKSAWLLPNNTNVSIIINQYETIDYPPLVYPTAAIHVKSIKKDPKIKYILQWTSSEHVPFLYMGTGRKGFIERNCEHANCYVTNYASLLKDYTKFDAVLFSGPDVRHYSPFMLPQRRSVRQKYVFVSTECNENYPVFLPQFDGFFNWTWTYKLDSDIRWGYIVVTDLDGKVVGPKKIMHWIKRSDMLTVPPALKRILDGKRKAVVWMSTNCYPLSDREGQVKKLQEVLKTQYDLDLDIYGDCGVHKCGESDDEDDNECNSIIQRDYYFYIAYEQTFGEDYVTEELLPALQYNAIPIVYGGANYSRFLPEGSYLNARELDTELLAAKINELIIHHRQYAEYFKWTNHYKFYSTIEHEETNQYCKMCELLNDEKKVRETSAYEDFRAWWNPKKYRIEYKFTTNSTPAMRAETNIPPFISWRPEKEVGFFYKLKKNHIKDIEVNDIVHDAFYVAETVISYYKRLKNKIF